MTTESSEYTAGLRALADLIDQNPDLHDDVRYSADRILVPVTHAATPRVRMAAWVRAAKAADLPIRKAYDEKWGEVNITLTDSLTVQVYADRASVCERIVVGTHEVTREVPDPDALAAVPTTTVVEVIEDVEWNCMPLLAVAS